MGTIEGGEEVISTEDLLAKIDDLNEEMMGWDEYSWWEGKTFKNYQACKECIGTWGDDQVDDELGPELCNCGRVIC